ncbi:hypothetical protein FRC02_002085, partial [Tulasnella sp. 418]
VTRSPSRLTRWTGVVGGGRVTTSLSLFLSVPNVIYIFSVTLVVDRLQDSLALGVVGGGTYYRDTTSFSTPFSDILTFSCRQACLWWWVGEDA